MYLANPVLQKPVEWRNSSLYVHVFSSHSVFFVLFLPQAAYKEWGSFQVYHSLFFKHQSFGPGGNNADTAGSDEGEGDAAQPSTPTS